VRSSFLASVFICFYETGYEIINQEALMSDSNSINAQQILRKYRDNVEAMSDEEIRHVLTHLHDPLSVLIPRKLDPAYMLRVLSMAFIDNGLLRELPRYIPSALIIEALQAHRTADEAASALMTHVPGPRKSQVMLDFAFEHGARCSMADLHPSLYTEENILRAINISSSTYIGIPTEYCTKAVVYATFCKLPLMFPHFPERYRNIDLVIHGVQNGVALDKIGNLYHSQIYQAWKAEPLAFSFEGIESFPESPESALIALNIQPKGKPRKAKANDALLHCYLRDQPLAEVWSSTRNQAQRDFLIELFESKILEVADVPMTQKRKWLEGELGI
jgi:hypothetical protein